MYRAMRFLVFDVRLLKNFPLTVNVMFKTGSYILKKKIKNKTDFSSSLIDSALVMLATHVEAQ